MDIIESIYKHTRQKVITKGTILQQNGDKNPKAFYVKKGLLSNGKKITSAFVVQNDYLYNMIKIDNLETKKFFYSSLNERQKRHFLGVEAQGFGHGGIIAVSKAFAVNRNTVSQGVKELKSEEKLPLGRIRKEGGGRKKNF